MPRRRITITLADVADLHPDIPATASIVLVETVGARAITLDIEWDAL